MDQSAADLTRRSISHLGLVVITALVMAVAAGASRANAAQAAQKTFASPEEAVKALVAATRDSDIKGLLALLGPAGRDLLFSGDPIADRELLLQFVQEYDTAHRLASEGERKAILHVGSDDWLLPIPIVKQGEVWRFDLDAGKQEILNRRIGRNELAANQVCRAMVDAQLEYATMDRMGDGVLQYAQRFFSTPGKHDGLYWATQEGEAPSPLGPLAARAAEQGYGGKVASGKPAPYHGFFYKMLKSQGKDASGGAYDYLAKGRMIGGFAILAYPARYGNSGVMTFVVNQDGVVYQKDLGTRTEKVAQTVRQYNPDSTWKKVD